MTEPLSRLPTLSRRTLLAGAAAAGLTAGMPPVRAAGLRWDGEAEIVIVGSGGAGVSAALAARERTKGRIVILEKLGVTGGSTRFSCGYFNAVDPERQRAQGIEDSLERHIADTNASGRGRGDPELVRILCSEALDALHWVEGYGVKYEPFCSQIYGGLFPRSHLPKLSDPQASYIDVLLDACRSRGIEILTSSPVLSLVLNEDGSAAGVVWRDASGMRCTLRASRAVVLASGGFSANAELCRLHDPRLGDLDTTNPAGSTGEVMLAAREAGAYLTGCDWIECIPLHVHYARFAILVERCIFVDQQGRRFVREDDRRDILRDTILSLPSRVGFVIVDHDGFESNPPSFRRELHEGLERQEVYRAQTLEEMAQLLRLPVNNFVETVNRYNGFVRSGRDEDFGRGVESMIHEIRKPPFWACRASMSRHHTMGGVSIDARARVLDWDSKPVGRLYAAGEVAGGVHGASRLGGNAIADVHVFGRIAGREAASEVPA